MTNAVHTGDHIGTSFVTGHTAEVPPVLSLSLHKVREAGPFVLSGFHSRG